MTLHCQVKVWNKCKHFDYNINDTDADRAEIITSTVGFTTFFSRVVWNAGNWVRVKASKPWIYAYPNPEDP